MPLLHKTLFSLIILVLSILTSQSASRCITKSDTTKVVTVKPNPIKDHIFEGYAIFETGDYHSAIAHLHSGMKSYRRSDSESSSKYERLALILITHAYKALAIRDSALLYSRKTIAFGQKTKEKWLEYNFTYTLATVYNDHNNTELAISYQLKAAQIAEESKDYAMAATCYGAASEYSRDKQKAIQWAETAISLAQKVDDDQELAGMLMFAASAYNNDNQLDKAADAYSKAMFYYDKTKDINSYKRAQNGLLSTYNKQQKQDSAWVVMNTAISQEEPAYNTDTMALPNSIQSVKLDLLLANNAAEERKVKLDVLTNQYWQDQASSLRTKIWLGSIVGGLFILTLLLLYGRQRLKSRARARYIDGLEGERQRISKELHDGVCNDLLALEMELKDEASNSRIEFLRSVRQDVRMLSHELMPPAFQYATIDEILQDYTSSLETPNGISVTFTPSQISKDISHSLAFQIYRIAQESVSNSLKHSAASKINIELTHQKTTTKLVVTDNGKGFNLSQKSLGVGLRTMQDRAIGIGGTLNITSNSSGTTIIFTYNDSGRKGKHTIS